MQRSPFAPAPTEDELADEAVRRGRVSGVGWLIASAAVFGVALAGESAGRLTAALVGGAALGVTGLAVRARYWRSARRRLGDATIQRALWRRTRDDHQSSRLVIAAALIVALVLAAQLW